VVKNLLPFRDKTPFLLAVWIFPLYLWPQVILEGHLLYKQGTTP